MGYTNYWEVKEKPQEFPKELLKDINKVKTSAIMNFIDFKILRLDKKGIIIQGNCEDFCIEVIEPKGRCVGFDSFRFCKTNRHPYDAVIKCVIMLCINHGIFSSWSFDGDEVDEEYLAAIELMKSAGLSDKIVTIEKGE